MLRQLRSAASLLALAFLAACGNAPISANFPPLIPSPRGPQRAVWVTRFDYKTRDDVLTILGRCKSAGFNTVLFQVRGNATAAYPSSFEPWSELLGGADPGFDPLETAVDAAHASGMRIAAWVNVMPAWWGKEPPKDPEQVCNRHPDWLWVDQHGKRQPFSNNFYVSLNPCLPEVRQYLVSVLRDLVARYSVDELHLDYLRFPNEQPPGEPDRSGLDYPRDARTVALFQADEGTTPDKDKTGWNRWRTEQVSNLLRDVRHMMRQTKPDVVLSAAVGVVPETALGHFQDARTWLAEDLLDVVYPMNYTSNTAQFRERLQVWLDLGSKHGVLPGISLESAGTDDAIQQIDASRREFQGFAIYAYSSLYDSANTAIAKQDDETRARRMERRKAILPVIQDLAQGGSKP